MPVKKRTRHPVETGKVPSSCVLRRASWGGLCSPHSRRGGLALLACPILLFVRSFCHAHTEKGVKGAWLGDTAAMLHYRRVVDTGGRQKRHGQNHEEEAHPIPRVWSRAISYITPRAPQMMSKALISPWSCKAVTAAGDQSGAQSLPGKRPSNLIFFPQTEQPRRLNPAPGFRFEV